MKVQVGIKILEVQIGGSGFEITMTLTFLVICLSVMLSSVTFVFYSYVPFTYLSMLLRVVLLKCGQSQSITRVVLNYLRPSPSATR